MSADPHDMTIYDIPGPDASLLYASQCYLGEGPFWHAGRKSCFWVDIEGRRLFEYAWPSPAPQDWKKLPESTRVREWQLGTRVTMVVGDQEDGLILGMEGGLAKFDPDTGELRWLVDIEKGIPKHRCNDGGVDSEGRLWVGTLHMDFDEGAGSVYCIGEDKIPRKKLEGVTISNGLVWSPDNTRLYYIDSPRRRVDTFLFDPASGDIRFEKIAFTIPAHLGGPDGMTIDEEGMLWVAHWGGFGVYRWNPATGQLLGSVKVPAPNASSCVFAGENLDHLVISTARQDLSAEELAKYPQSGDVFVARLSVRGLPHYACRY
ncbi:MAG: SMP-30/gluconolactonase/LRE family protein [Puia sp.]|nr:SMP-30/gluconolactonase/LRE family protein [Puia sp.]